MDRREFLKKAGVGSAAVAGLPALGTVLATPVWAAGVKATAGWFFVAVSHSTTTPDLLLISGCGVIQGSSIEGGGSFAHITPDADGPPFPVLASGHWRPTELVSFDPLGDPFGTLVAGIAVWNADLKVTTPFRDVTGATMEMVCNIVPANLIHPGKDEGVVVTVPAVSQTFVPSVPPVGLTVFTVGGG